MDITSTSLLTQFTFEEKTQKVTFIETTHVKAGVDCDVYTFDNDNTKDLGIIRIQKGARTPLQRVLKGDKTIEGNISGKGRLVIGLVDGSQNVYEVDDTKGTIEIEVKIGENMQWQAETDMVAYEICFPPYADGRYENLPE